MLGNFQRKIWLTNFYSEQSQWSYMTGTYCKDWSCRFRTFPEKFRCFITFQYLGFRDYFSKKAAYLATQVGNPEKPDGKYFARTERSLWANQISKSQDLTRSTTIPVFGKTSFLSPLSLCASFWRLSLRTGFVRVNWPCETDVSRPTRICSTSMYSKWWALSKRRWRTGFGEIYLFDLEIVLVDERSERG